MITGAVDDQILARAVEAAGVDEAHRAAFEKGFRSAIGEARAMSTVLARAFRLTPAEAHERFDDLAASLKVLERGLGKAPDLFLRFAPADSLLAPVKAEAFAREVADWRREMERLRDDVVIKSGRPVLYDDKLVAANQAYFLLRDHGAAPTMTAGGPFIKLAEVLFEALTGRRPERKGDGLEAVCKRIHRGQRASAEKTAR